MSDGRWWSGRKVLVTGASGFIGTHLAARLVWDGAMVHGVWRRNRPYHDSPVVWHRCDLTEVAAVDRLLRAVKPEVVFHLASHVAGTRALEAVGATFRDNLATTVHLLMAAADVQSPRIVLAGSMEEPADGGAIPCSPYAAAKWAAGGYARLFHALYGTPVTLARIFMVYGPGQHDLKKIIPYVTLSLLRGESPALTSGERKVDWIYVEDVVEGLLALARAEGIAGETVDLGSGRLESVRWVAERLADIVGGNETPEFGAIPDRSLEQVRTARVDLTAERIGWRPSVTLEEGLERTVDWYRDQLARGGLD